MPRHLPSKGRASILAGRRNRASAVLLITVSAVASASWSGAYAVPIDIVPSFSSSITSDPNAAAIEATINTAISFYNGNITTPSTDPVNITFQEMSTGLGSSLTTFYKESYASFLGALAATSSGDSTDTTALTHLPTVAGYFATYGTATINVAAADARGLGYVIPLANDSTISLNTSITDLGGPTSGTQYSLLAVTEHEIDEALGLGSDVGKTGFFSDPNAEDLYRYDGSGNRSYTSDSTALAYFSFDGLTKLAQFDNQNDGADFGDWQSNPFPPGVSPQVQDAFATAGVDPKLGLTSPEVVALDAIGYNLSSQTSSVPEPSSLLLLSTGLLWLRTKFGRRGTRPRD